MSNETANIQNVEDKFSFERKEWGWQKIFYWIFGAFLISGVLGVFGNGILSRKNIKGEGFTVKYDRFMREESPSKLEISLNRTEDPLSVSLSKNYLEMVEIQNIVPEPESVKVKDGDLVYNFKVENGGLITFYLKPQSGGPKELKLAVQGKVNNLNQFVYF